MITFEQQLDKFSTSIRDLWQSDINGKFGKYQKLNNEWCELRKELINVIQRFEKELDRAEYEVKCAHSFISKLS